jgi:hypothetical protein
MPLRRNMLLSVAGDRRSKKFKLPLIQRLRLNLRMKNLILLVFLSITQVSLAAISIVSDIDDTVVITLTGKEVDGSVTAAYSPNVFSGMPAFFSGAREYAPKLHLLSPAPLLLRGLIQPILRRNGIEPDSLILRNPLRREEGHVFKLSELRRLLERSGDDFILIGDDVGKDPEVFDEIKRHFPERILAIYIHVVKNRELPKTATRYWTAFDLALREYQAGRMQKSWVSEVLQAVAGEEEKKHIFPWFAHCPKTPSVWLWQVRTPFVREGLQLGAELSKHCLLRWSDTLPFPRQMP